MPVDVIIQDPNTGQLAQVNDEGHQVISLYNCPPLLPQKNRVFSDFLRMWDDDGEIDMGITGAVNPQEFWIRADNDDDRYITAISFVLGYGASAQMWEFADADVALANGVLIQYNDTYNDLITVANLTRNLDFMRLSHAPFSDTGWESRGFAAAGDYGYFATIDFTKMIPPHGIKLDRGTVQRLVVTIRDDCTDADLFNCHAFGFDRFE